MTPEDMEGWESGDFTVAEDGSILLGGSPGRRREGGSPARAASGGVSASAGARKDGRARRAWSGQSARAASSCQAGEAGRAGRQGQARQPARPAQARQSNSAPTGPDTARSDAPRGTAARAPRRADVENREAAARAGGRVADVSPAATGQEREGSAPQEDARGAPTGKGEESSPPVPGASDGMVTAWPDRGVSVPLLEGVLPEEELIADGAAGQPESWEPDTEGRDARNGPREPAGQAGAYGPPGLDGDSFGPADGAFAEPFPGRLPSGFPGADRYTMSFEPGAGARAAARAASAADRGDGTRHERQAADPLRGAARGLAGDVAAGQGSGLDGGTAAGASSSREGAGTSARPGAGTRTGAPGAGAASPRRRGRPPVLPLVMGAALLGCAGLFVWLFLWEEGPVAGDPRLPTRSVRSMAPPITADPGTRRGAEGRSRAARGGEGAASSEDGAVAFARELEARRERETKRPLAAARSHEDWPTVGAIPAGAEAGREAGPRDAPDVIPPGQGAADGPETRPRAGAQAGTDARRQARPMAGHEAGQADSPAESATARRDGVAPPAGRHPAVEEVPAAMAAARDSMEPAGANASSLEAATPVARQDSPSSAARVPAVSPRAAAAAEKPQAPASARSPAVVTAPAPQRREEPADADEGLVLWPTERTALAGEPESSRAARGARRSADASPASSAGPGLGPPQEGTDGAISLESAPATAGETAALETVWAVRALDREHGLALLCDGGRCLLLGPGEERDGVRVRAIDFTRGLVATSRGVLAFGRRAPVTWRGGGDR